MQATELATDLHAASLGVDREHLGAGLRGASGSWWGADSFGTAMGEGWEYWDFGGEILGYIEVFT